MTQIEFFVARSRDPLATMRDETQNLALADTRTVRP